MIGKACGEDRRKAFRTILIALVFALGSTRGAGSQDIHQAARSGRREIVAASLADAMLAGRGAFDAPDANGLTPLMYAAWFNPDPGVVELFLDSGARLEYSPGSGWSAAVLSAWNENPAVFELLARRGADLRRTDEYGTTILMLAARYNPNPEVLKSILRAGAEVDARNQQGWTALMYAVESNSSLAVIQLLIDEGAKIDTSFAQAQAQAQASENRACSTIP